jgi:hypothetical protein
VPNLIVVATIFFLLIFARTAYCCVRSHELSDCMPRCLRRLFDAMGEYLSRLTRGNNLIEFLLGMPYFLFGLPILMAARVWLDVNGVGMACIIMARRIVRSTPEFPRLWDLLGYLLPPETRRRIYEPAMENLRADYYETRRRFRTRWSRRFLRFAFAFRTVLLLLDCFRVMGADRLLLPLVPKTIRRWWLG